MAKFTYFKKAPKLDIPTFKVTSPTTLTQRNETDVGFFALWTGVNLTESDEDPARILTGRLTRLEEGYYQDGRKVVVVRISGLNFDARLIDTAYLDLNPDKNFFRDGVFKDSDTILGGNFPEHRLGYGGDDLINGNGGKDILEGGQGADLLFGGKGADELFGGRDDDRLSGGAHNDFLRGNAGDDRLQGDDGRDSLQGDGGNDTLEGGSGADNLKGNGGSDVLQGGDGDDVLNGGNGRDTLRGEAGNDTAQGGNLADEIRLDRGNDLGKGGGGNDLILGGAGNDVLMGQKGNDTVDGGSGRDTIDGNQGSDALVGAGGNDLLRGGGGGDELVGGKGSDTLQGGAGGDTLSGNRGRDELNGGADADRLIGGNGNDRLQGDDGEDTLGGGQGDDTLIGGEGDDSLLGGTGNDRLAGEAGNDTQRGGDGDDTLAGGTGDDLIAGEAGDDRMFGGAELDTLLGGAGADQLLVTGTGDLTGRVFDGGEDRDTLILQPPGTGPMQADLRGATLLGLEAVDLSTIPARAKLLEVSARQFGPEGLSPALTLIGAGAASIGAVFAISMDGVAEFDLSAFGFTDWDDPSGAGDLLRVQGSALGETLRGSDRREAVFAAGGDDSLMGNDGDDFLSGEDGNDTVLGNVGNDTVLGGLGDDSVLGGFGDDVVRGGDGDDTIGGGDGTDLLDGGRGDDLIQFHTRIKTSFAGDTIFGGEGRDVLRIDALTGEDQFADLNQAVLGSLEMIGFADGPSRDRVMQFAASQVGPGLSDTLLVDGGSGDAGKETVRILMLDRLALDLSGWTFQDWSPAKQVAPADTIRIIGDDDDETIVGTIVAAEIRGGGGADALSGGDEGDTLIGGAGDDCLSGGGGNDSLEGSDGGDVIDGGGGGDTLHGQTGADRLFGGAGADMLFGGADADELFGDGGADSFIVLDGFGADTVTGGEDLPASDALDTLDLSGLSMAATVTWTGNEAGTATDGADTLSFTQIERVLGTASGDTFDATADSAGVRVDGGDGDDSLTGGAAADTLRGGAGGDLLAGGTGSDLLDGGADDDRFTFGGSTDGDTVIGGEEGFDYDLLDFQSLGRIVVTFTGDEAGTALNGALSVTFSEIEAVETTFGDDSVDAGLDTSGVNIIARGGADTLTGGTGSDRFSIQDGFGGSILDGGEDGGYDELDLSSLSGPVSVTYTSDRSGFLSQGEESLRFSRLDQFYLTSEADTFDASEDTYGINASGGGGADTLIGGSGDDYFEIEGHDGSWNDAQVDGGAGDFDNLSLYGLDSGVTVTHSDGAGTVTDGTSSMTYLGIERLDLTSGADSLDASLDSGGIGVFTSGGADTLIGGSGADSFFLSAFDSIGGTASLDGGAGVDRFTVQGVGSDATIAVAGDGSGSVSDGTNAVTFSAIEDRRFNGTFEAERLDAGSSTGGVSLDAYEGDDTLIGGSGDDTLEGGAGADLLTGGAGADIFRFGSFSFDRENGYGEDTRDTVLDFMPGADQLLIFAERALGNTYITANGTDFAHLGGVKGARPDVILYLEDTGTGDDILAATYDDFLGGSPDPAALDFQIRVQGDGIDNLDLTLADFGLTAEFTASSWP